MIRLIGLWVVGCALCATPVAAEDVYDGPTAVRPLTVTPKPQPSAPPNTVCDYEHQCYPEKGGPVAKAPAAPPVVEAKPAAPPPAVAQDTRPDEPIVASWRNCMAQALQTYEHSHALHALQLATGSCQVRLEEAQGDENFAWVAQPATPLTAPAPQPAPQVGRRNIGCGWWPIGSDADRDCAAGGHRF